VTQPKPMTGPELFNSAQDLLLAFPDDQTLDADPDAEERWIDQLEAWAGMSGTKIESYRAAFEAAKARLEFFDEMVASYQKAAKRQASIMKRIDHLARLLLGGAEKLTGAPELECQDGTKVKLQRRRNQRVDVIDESSVPGAYIRIKTSRSVDKAGAKKVLKAGEEIAGLALLESVSETVKWGR